METSIFWPDFIILMIILVSVAISFFRGFIKEVISLVTWVVAAWLAFMLASPLSGLMTFTEVQSVRAIIAFMVVFIGLIFLGSIVNFLVGKFIRKTPFSLADRTLGIGFGFLRGFLLVTLIVFFAGLTPLPKDDWWQQSFTLSQVEKVALWFKDLLPESMGEHFEFDPEPNSDSDSDSDPGKKTDLESS